MSAQTQASEIRGLIREAAHHGITLFLDGDQLRYQTVRDEVPPQFLTRLQSRREGITAELSRPRYRKRDAARETLQFPAYWMDFWNQTAANPSLANLTHFVIKLSETSLSSIESAVETVCLRHDLLRARVAIVNDAPCIFFNARDRVPIELIDLSANGVPDSRQIEDALRGAIWAPFEDGYLFRACVLTTSASDILLACVIHHFVCDFPSCQTVAGEMLTALRGRRTILESSQNRPMQYADFLTAMDEWLAGPGGPYRLEYWKEKMAGAPAIWLPRHFNTATPDMPSVESSGFRIDEPLRAAIAGVATDAGVTVATMVLAANFAALWSILGTGDLVTTLIASGREHPALLGLVGPAVNCIPVRVNLVADMSWRDLVMHVRETYLLAQDYQIPFTLLMRTLAPLNVCLVAPVFNFIAGRGVAGKVHSFLGAGAADNGAVLHRPAEAAQADWMSHELNVVDLGTSMSGVVRYNPTKYRRDTMEKFVECLISRLVKISSDLDGRIGD